jgi:hypothetical protein
LVLKDVDLHLSLKIIIYKLYLLFLFQGHHENPFVSNQAMACSGMDYFSEDSEQSPKRFRQESS